MKKSKILSVITIFIAITLIITGYSIIFINDYRVDAEESSNYASLIKNSYDSYYDNLERISYEIKETTIFNIKYYDQIRINYINSINELTTIENHIKELETMSDTLLHECSVREYRDNDIDNKCENINYNYESVINAFVEMKDEYNKNINSYNTWNKNGKKLTKYEAHYYRDYIDINSDGEYVGKV